MLVIILLILAAVCFILSAFRVESTRVSFLALGLLFWVVSVLVPKL